MNLDVRELDPDSVIVVQSDRNLQPEDRYRLIDMINGRLRQAGHRGVAVLTEPGVNLWTYDDDALRRVGLSRLPVSPTAVARLNELIEIDPEALTDLLDQSAACVTRLSDFIGNEHITVLDLLDHVIGLTQLDRDDDGLLTRARPLHIREEGVEPEPPVNVRVLVASLLLAIALLAVVIYVALANVRDA